MLASVLSEALIYQTANRLIEQHGAKAMTEANRLLSRALERREQESALVMLRVRSAVASLQAPRSGPLHLHLQAAFRSIPRLLRTKPTASGRSTRRRGEPPQLCLQVIEVHRLGEELEGAQFARLAAALVVPIGGDH